MNLPRTLMVLSVPGVLLVACGGGADLPPEGASADSRATVASATGAADAPKVRWPVAPLLGDDGSAMPTSPQAVPADPGARTRAGRYASPAQADQLEWTMGPGLVRVAVPGSGAEAVEVAEGIVHGLMAAGNLPASAPVLIDGADARAAAALVDRLAAVGVTNTWLVTQ